MFNEIIKSFDKFLVVSNQTLFQGLSINQLIFIANRSQIVEYGKGDIICNEGQKRDFLNIVISGRVSLFHPAAKTKDKKERNIEILRKGDYFGVISLLTNRPHSVSARVINDARILRIEYKIFQQILDQIPRLAIHFSKTLSRRLKVKYAGEKAIYQSTILAAYYDGDEEYLSRYIHRLGEYIKRESKKDVIIVNINKKVSRPDLRKVEFKSVNFNKREDVISLVNNLTNKYHFLILGLPRKIDHIGAAVIKQSDICHILSDGTPHRIKETIDLLKKLGKKKARIVVRERENSRKAQAGIILKQFSSKKVYASLSSDEGEYSRTLRRIARDVAGVLVGLALGSGGAVGLAQIGVLKVLEEENILIDIIAGTSIGSLIGALWANGFKADEIETMCGEYNTVFKALGLLDITIPRKGFIGGRNIRKFLTKYLGKKTFSDLHIPFSVVACDIGKREEIVLSEGSVVDAVRASIAIPGILNPFMTKNGRCLVDGGIVNPVPISVLSKQGVKRIIAVNTMPSPEDIMKSSKKRQTIIDIIVNSIYSMEYRIGKDAAQEADVYIHPILENTAWYEFYKLKEFVEFGKKETEKMIPELKKLNK